MARPNIHHNIMVRHNPGTVPLGTIKVRLPTKHSAQGRDINLTPKVSNTCLLICRTDREDGRATGPKPTKVNQARCKHKHLDPPK